MILEVGQIQLALKLVAKCLLNIDTVDVGSGILVRFFLLKLHVELKICDLA